ncbi:conserved hypothetical protein [Gammaproteobacteria bacterium]
MACVALDDRLLSEFYAFKHGQLHDVATLEKLLHLYKPPHITNVDQLKRIGIEDRGLRQSLAASNLINQSVEELASLTTYKLLLSTTSTTFPHVNIYNDSLGNHYTITCKPGDPRTKAHNQIRALMADAKDILIYDRFMKEQWDSTKKIFTLVPKKPLTLIFANSLDQDHKKQVKTICPNWKVKEDRLNTYVNHHDRYILIDRKMEIILTSGIDYLFDITKESHIIFHTI